MRELVFVLQCEHRILKILSTDNVSSAWNGNSLIAWNVCSMLVGCVHFFVAVEACVRHICKVVEEGKLREF